MKVIKHVKCWNEWRRYSEHTKFYKFLTLLGARHPNGLILIKWREKFKGFLKSLDY